MNKLRLRGHPLELFFDLVFVFAVSQLSVFLLEQLPWRSMLGTLLGFAKLAEE